MLGGKAADEEAPIALGRAASAWVCDCVCECVRKCPGVCVCVCLWSECACFSTLTKHILRNCSLCTQRRWRTLATLAARTRCALPMYVQCACACANDCVCLCYAMWRCCPCVQPPHGLCGPILRGTLLKDVAPFTALSFVTQLSVWLGSGVAYLTAKLGSPYSGPAPTLVLARYEGGWVFHAFALPQAASGCSDIALTKRCPDEPAVSRPEKPSARLDSAPHAEVWASIRAILTRSDTLEAVEVDADGGVADTVTLLLR